jgi:hypothetical protein
MHEIRGSTPTSTRSRNGSRRSAAWSATSSTPPTPDIVETIKRTVQPYFVLDGNVAALLAAKDHVNVLRRERRCDPQYLDQRIAPPFGRARQCLDSRLARDPETSLRVEPPTMRRYNNNGPYQ